MSRCETIRIGVAEPPALILYEYPFNESVRTMLRLEHLFGRLHEGLARTTAAEHHHALATMFELLDVAGRADLKSDLLRDLDRHRAQLQGLRGNPAIAEQALEDFLRRIDTAHGALQTQQGKAGQSLLAHDWLMSVRSRFGIPGGSCGFDLPSYHHWLHRPVAARQADLARWSSTLQPWRDALELVLVLLRESGQPQQAVAVGGQLQQTLSQQRSQQLLRLWLPAEADLVPEISGNRLMVSVRLLRLDAEGRSRPHAEDTGFTLALCG